MTSDKKITVFTELLEAFETNMIRDYCKDMIKEIPDYIFEIPSSTSLKYHNATQCQRHGQLYHIRMFGEIMNYILGLEYTRTNIATTPDVRDLMRCTAILHDALKCGRNGSKYSVFEHPALAAEWVKNSRVEHDIPDEYKQMLSDMCMRHSGEWNTSKRSAFTLDKPENSLEFCVHLCDYLSSRSNIDMEYSEDFKAVLAALDGEIYERKEVKETPVTPETYTMPFGKHSGKTLIQIKNEDPSYITWAKENMGEPLKGLLAQI